MENAEPKPIRKMLIHRLKKLFERIDDLTTKLSEAESELLDKKDVIKLLRRAKHPSGDIGDGQAAKRPLNADIVRSLVVCDALQKHADPHSLTTVAASWFSLTATL